MLLKKKKKKKKYGTIRLFSIFHDNYVYFEINTHIFAISLGFDEGKELQACIQINI